MSTSRSNEPIQRAWTLVDLLRKLAAISSRRLRCIQPSRPAARGYRRYSGITYAAAWSTIDSISRYVTGKASDRPGREPIYDAIKMPLFFSVSLHLTDLMETSCPINVPMHTRILQRTLTTSLSPYNGVRFRHEVNASPLTLNIDTSSF